MVDKIKKLIKQGETIHVELKLANQGLPHNIFETVCAFLNREGGTIILGVRDDKKIIGVPDALIEKIKKDFASLCNNSQKIFPTVHLCLQELKINNCTLLYVEVPESEEVHFSNSKIYDRSEDGDYNVTRNTATVAAMYMRKRRMNVENDIYPFVTLNDLRLDLIESARKWALIKNKNHPWKNMDDLELLKSAKLYDKDEITGNEGINLAGILIFGKDELIQRLLPYYKFDALLRVHDEDRYDDRDYIVTNLIDACNRLVAFVQKHLPDPFYLEDNRRTSIRDIIAREICVNMVIHRDYSSFYAGRLIIKKNEIYTEKPNVPKKTGYININHFIPYTKNPVIANFFRQIDYADELGSGIRKLKKYTQIYSGEMPIFKEGELFLTSIPIHFFDYLDTIPEFVSDTISNEVTSKYENVILHFCETEKSSREIMEYIGLKNTEYFRKSVLNPLVKKGVLLLTIPDKPRSGKQKYVSNFRGNTPQVTREDTTEVKL